MTAADGESGDEADTPRWREWLTTAWEWITGVFHGYAGTEQLRKRGP